MTTIRVATLDDCGAIARVHVAAWHESFAKILPVVAFQSMTETIRTRAFQHRMETQPLLPIYVAEQSGTVVGFANGGPEVPESGLGQEMGVYAVFLIARAKRQGIGTKLLQSVVADFLNSGACSAGLWTLRDAAEARHFYESMGAVLVSQRVKRRPGYERAEVGYVWPDLKRAFSF